jgi:muramoyltetrapeptide carboxypeptidase
VPTLKIVLMNRRNFSKLSLSAWPMFSFANLSVYPNPTPVKPPKLKPGDSIGLISPGSFINDEKLKKAITNLESLGLNVHLSKNIRAQKGFTAGSIKQRVDDIHEMFSKNEIKGIWCARGGYGCAELLPHIDYSLISKNPKILIGFSDITALLHAIHMKTGLITFHGPVASSEFTPFTFEALKNILFNPQPKHTISKATYAMRTGKAEGIITGGNLTLLAAAAGTPYIPDFKEKIVILEEIGEKPYRIHRMINQLKQATNLFESAAILMGQFWDCEPGKGELSLSLEDTLRDSFQDFLQPIAYGFPWGHIDNLATTPIGIKALADTENLTLTLLETGVLN